MSQPAQRKEFESFKLCPTTVFGTFQLSIPDFLQELSADEMLWAFPANMKNKIWLVSNEQKDMMLQVTYLDADLPVLKIEDILHHTCSQMRRITPGFQLFAHGTKTVNGVTVACINYKSSTINNDNYNIMFMFSLCKKIFAATFSAPLVYQEEWIQAFLLMIDTLQPINGDAELGRSLD